MSLQPGVDRRRFCQAVIRCEPSAFGGFGPEIKRGEVIALRSTQNRKTVEHQFAHRLRMLCGVHRGDDGAGVMPDEIRIGPPLHGKCRRNDGRVVVERRAVMCRIGHTEAGHIERQRMKACANEPGHHRLELRRR